MLKKLKEFFTNDHIQMSLATGACIIVLALFFKKVMHQEVPPIEAAIPAALFAFWEGARKKYKDSLLGRPLLWGAAMLLSVGITILVHLI